MNNRSNLISQLDAIIKEQTETQLPFQRRILPVDADHPQTIADKYHGLHPDDRWETDQEYRARILNFTSIKDKP